MFLEQFIFTIQNTPLPASLLHKASHTLIHFQVVICVVLPDGVPVQKGEIHTP